MGCYTIEISTGGHKLKTIVIEFGKSRRNIFPMGMCASSEIFKDKVDRIIRDNKGLKTYIKDVIVFGKGGF